jgi:hypothetical protein
MASTRYILSDISIFTSCVCHRRQGVLVRDFEGKIMVLSYHVDFLFRHQEKL